MGFDLLELFYTFSGSKWNVGGKGRQWNGDQVCETNKYFIEKKTLVRDEMWEGKRLEMKLGKLGPSKYFPMYWK